MTVECECKCHRESKRIDERAAWRVGRVEHRCALCHGTIVVGERHIEYTVFPSSDLAYANHPTRFRECAACIAARTTFAEVGAK